MIRREREWYIEGETGRWKPRKIQKEKNIEILRRERHRDKGVKDIEGQKEILRQRCERER